MKTLTFKSVRVLLIAVHATAAFAGEPMTRPFANFEEFNGFYNGVVDRMAKSGVRVQQTCFSASRYCANSMSNGSPETGYIIAFNIHQADGVDLQEVCFGGLTTRRCAFSNGLIYDQRRQGDIWANARLVADGFGQ